MPRFYFDVELNDGWIERDPTGLMRADAATALHECIDAIIGLPRSGVARVMVRNSNGGVVMTIDVNALGADARSGVEENNSH